MAASEGLYSYCCQLRELKSPTIWLWFQEEDSTAHLGRVVEYSIVSANIHVVSHKKMCFFLRHYLITWGFWVDFGVFRLSRLSEPHGGAESYVLYGQPVYLFGLLPVAQIRNTVGIQSDQGEVLYILVGILGVLLLHLSAFFHRLHRLHRFRAWSRKMLRGCVSSVQPTCWSTFETLVGLPCCYASVSVKPAVNGLGWSGYSIS